MPFGKTLLCTVIKTASFPQKRQSKTVNQQTGVSTAFAGDAASLAAFSFKSPSRLPQLAAAKKTNIPTIITQALTQQKILLGAMHPTRDLNFVSDTVEGFIRVAETPGIEGRTYHIGTGKEISVGDLAEKIISVIGRDIPILFDASRIRPTSSEVGRLICDASRAREEIGWEPKVSLEDGLSQTIEWIGRNLASYRPGDYAI